ncbi:MAG: hypothetical protein FJZ01_08565, partial [Candidatus Sericytochromatia bacterium]|nr:hypothetical protein [Candidatus Tanganyikabacteria bacterium]
QLAELGPREVRTCLACHAPLHEQQPFTGAGARNRAFDAGLQHAGVACAACHMRGRVWHGPPRKAGHDPGIAWPEEMPHGEVVRTDLFEESRFCASCHQFAPDADAPGGKPLENTYEEWRASEFAARGVSCQACHMPDRAHRFRGIHDPATVAGGLELNLDASGATLRSVGVGHMFPTYATPRVVLALIGRDAAGKPHLRREHAIARVVDFSTKPPRELSDTRLAPGRAVTIPLPAVGPGASYRAEVRVEPDFFYAGEFRRALAAPHDPEVRKLLAEALRRATASPYVALSAEFSP